MSHWKVNPTARIDLDFCPILLIGTGVHVTQERLDNLARIEGLYRLASLTSDYLSAAVERALASNDPAVCALIESKLITPGGDDVAQSQTASPAFALDLFAEMHKLVQAKQPILRDGVAIYDGVLPESVRSSVDLWTRTIAYSRLDVDHSNAADLHWIHILHPSVLCVQALPFLRSIDSLVRGHSGASLQILRSYVYAGQANDIYHGHVDSEEWSDITAIFYPPQWNDSWGGDLIFYEEKEPRWAVAPRGNRLIVFNGARRHRISPISFAAKVTRCSIVLRYGCA